MDGLDEGCTDAHTIPIKDKRNIRFNNRPPGMVLRRAGCWDIVLVGVKAWTMAGQRAAPWAGLWGRPRAVQMVASSVGPRATRKAGVWAVAMVAWRAAPWAVVWDVSSADLNYFSFK